MGHKIVDKIRWAITFDREEHSPQVSIDKASSQVQFGTAQVTTDGTHLVQVTCQENISIWLVLYLNLRQTRNSQS